MCKCRREKAYDYTSKIIFVLFSVIGCAASVGAVTGFEDEMIFAMSVPNVIGRYFLYPKVREEVKRYSSAIKEKKAEKASA